MKSGVGNGPDPFHEGSVTSGAPLIRAAANVLASVTARPAAFMKGGVGNGPDPFHEGSIRQTPFY